MERAVGGAVIWITGLPGSGKSALADALKDMDPSLLVLRMDDLRRTATPIPTYSDQERDVLYRALVWMARTASSLGHDVVIDATGSMRTWRELARREIPVFAEAYLMCPLAVRREREAGRASGARSAPPDVYKKGDEGWPVPGVSAPYEEPLQPELVIDTVAESAREGARRLMALLLSLRERAGGDG